MSQLSINSDESQRPHPAIKVLLIEDSEADCATYVRYLEADRNYTYHISSADSLEAGMNLWQSQAPHVVLVDMNLPDGNGLEFLEWLQNNQEEGEFQAKVPVVILTGQGNERVAVRAMKLGAMDYLVKDDITAISLQKSIMAVIEYQTIARQLTRSHQQKGLLSEIALRIRQSLDLSQILQSAVEGLRQLLTCDRALIYQFQPDWSGRVTVESVCLEELAILNQEIVDSCFVNQWHQPYREGRTSYVNDREDGSLKPCYAELLASIQVRANLVTPILQDENLWGLLIAQECHHPHYWETSEIRWTQQLATQVSIAIQQATAYTQLQQLNQDLEDRVIQRTAALQQSESRLQEAQKIACMGHWEVDLQTEQITWSPEVFHIFGLRPNQPYPSYSEVLQFFTEPDRDRIITTAQIAIQTRGAYELDIPFTRTNGSSGYLYVKGKSIQNQQGEVTGLVGILMDISDRKQNEAALVRYIQEIEDLYNNAPCGYHSLDPMGNLIRVNETELQWLGYTREEMVGRSFTEFLTEESRQKFSETYPTFCQQGWVKDLEFELVCKNGSILPVLINATAVTDAEGNYLHSRSTLLDISKRKQFEQQLRRTNAELTHATRLKDEFLANMSHELRTPLNSILGMSDVLQEEIYGALNDKQQQYLGVINQSGKHLLSLINDILDLSKIESGTMELQPQPISVTELCNSSLSFVKQTAHEKKIRLYTLISYDIGEIKADVLRLRQALINLLSNAVKFTPEGGKITLEAKRDPVQQTIQFSVTDTGIGIAEADLPKLFQAFVQIDSSLSREYNGTGLGLALVKKIVELHQGTVAVESTVGQGSCFTITLPDYTFPDHSLPDDASAHTLPTQANPTPSSQPIQTDPDVTEQPTPQFLVLLAEDSPTNIETFSDYLLYHGYRLLVATDGQEAVSLAKEHRPDVVLMDIQMPKMDGLEAIRQIRDIPTLAATPIVALTALAMTGDRERCLAAGANEYLTKPVRLKHLVEIIKSLAN